MEISQSGQILPSIPRCLHPSSTSALSTTHTSQTNILNYQYLIHPNTPKKSQSQTLHHNPQNEQRLNPNPPPHAPSPTSRLLRRLHTPPHLRNPQHNNNLPPLQQPHRNLRLLIPDPRPLLPPHRRHLRRAAVSAPKPRGRG